MGHHHIGAELARKYGMDERIVHAIEAHHDDIEATTPEALVVRVVDAASAARPGARNNSAENFAERMRDLENVATSFDGISKAYAISAGREVRVIVTQSGLMTYRPSSWLVISLPRLKAPCSIPAPSRSMPSRETSGLSNLLSSSTC